MTTKQTVQQLPETIKIAAKDSDTHFAIPFKEARKHAKYFDKCAEYSIARNEELNENELFIFEYSVGSIELFANICNNIKTLVYSSSKDVKIFADYIQSNQVKYIAQTMLLDDMCKHFMKSLHSLKSPKIYDLSLETILFPDNPIQWLYEKKLGIFNAAKTIDENICVYKIFIIKLFLWGFKGKLLEINFNKTTPITICIHKTQLYDKYKKNGKKLSRDYINAFIDLFDVLYYMNDATDIDLCKKFVKMIEKLCNVDQNIW